MRTIGTNESVILAHVGSSQAALVLAVSILGAIGFHRLSAPRTNQPRSARGRRRLWYWFGGLTVLMAAELPPLGTYVDERFSVHMVQHLIFCFVAAPLFVMARPGVVVARTLSPRMHRSDAVRTARRVLGPALSPAIGWSAFVGYTWVVHFTPLYDFALSNPAVHSVEHVGFLVTAVLLWRPVLGPRQSALPDVLKVPYVLLLMPALAFCGLAIFSADHPLYSSYRSFPGSLADQRLGGAIMWALPIVALLPLVLGLVVAWWRREERVQALLEGPAPAPRSANYAARSSHPAVPPNVR
jgi:putative membrane protein